MADTDKIARMNEEVLVEDEEVASQDVMPSPSPAKKATFQSSLDRFMHKPKSEELSFSNDIGSNSTGTGSDRKRSIQEVLKGTTSSSKSPSPEKKRRQSAKYAPPAQYAHLSELTDIIESNLLGIFVGFNPGVTTATKGHAYAHPTNMFWRLLHSSGITDVRLRPEQDVDLPRLFSMGNTNIVSRPSKAAGELSKQEMSDGARILDEKFRAFKPESVCIVGKSIWQAIWRWKYKQGMKKDDFKYGWQDAKERMGKDGDWPGAWVFVATATSGLAANLKPHEKEEIWKPYGEWIQKRREERLEEATSGEEAAASGEQEA